MKKTYFTYAIISLFVLLGTGMYAQTTTGDITKQATGTATGSIKLIDNKGTIKYLQTANGLTTLTNSTNDLTTTTWQLGGTLNTDTYIDVDGNAFVLNGLELVTTTSPTTGGATLSSASTDTTSLSDHGTGTGWTLLIRDEATGAIKKLKATDLIQSGSFIHTQSSNATTTFDITVGGISEDASQVWVYRNGAKLLVTTDYTVGTDKVTLKPGASDGNFPVYANDVIEIQWIK